MTIKALLHLRHYTVISCLFREQSKLLTRGAGDDLRTGARPKATVPKSSPAQREQSKPLTRGAGDDLRTVA